MNRRRFALVSGYALLALVACVSPRRDAGEDRRAVEAGLQLYGALIRAMDADGVAALFAEDGELGTNGQPPHRGRDDIRAYLKSFGNVKVLSDEMTTASIDVAGDSAMARGSYQQTAKVGDDAPVHVHGGFEAVWVRQSDGRWLIKRMTAFPEA